MRKQDFSASISRWALLSVALVLAGPAGGTQANDLKRREWKVEGVTREALIYVPENATEGGSPLVFAFHGHGGNTKNAAVSFAYHRLWPEAISVYMQGLRTPGLLMDPDGRKSGWQHVLGAQNDRDLKFFDVVLATLKKDYPVDDKRVYATGHSNGGAFTYLLWAVRGDAFAAVAPEASPALIGEPPDSIPDYAAELLEAASKSMKDIKPKPVLHVAGEYDPLVRYSWQKLTIDGLRKLNQCGEGEPWGEYCTMYPSPLKTPVVTYIHKGGHRSPPDAHVAIVRFFKQHSKP